MLLGGLGECMATNADPDAATISVDRLRQELGDAAGAPTGDNPERVLSSVLDELFAGEEFDFDEEMIKGSLDELLLVLVALRDQETHGKGLMEDLTELFDAPLSPGTVYPRLHEMAESDLLEVHELVRTKEYHLEDAERAREEVTAAMRQHLALGLFLGAALDELEPTRN